MSLFRTHTDRSKGPKAVGSVSSSALSLLESQYFNRASVGRAETNETEIDENPFLPTSNEGRQKLIYPEAQRLHSVIDDFRVKTHLLATTGEQLENNGTMLRDVEKNDSIASFSGMQRDRTRRVLNSLTAEDRDRLRALAHKYIEAEEAFNNIIPKPNKPKQTENEETEIMETENETEILSEEQEMPKAKQYKDQKIAKSLQSSTTALLRALETNQNSKVKETLKTTKLSPNSQFFEIELLLSQFSVLCFHKLSASVEALQAHTQCVEMMKVKSETTSQRLSEKKTELEKLKETHKTETQHNTEQIERLQTDIQTLKTANENTISETKTQTNENTKLTQKSITELEAKLKEETEKFNIESAERLKENRKRELALRKKKQQTEKELYSWIHDKYDAEMKELDKEYNALFEEHESEAKELHEVLQEVEKLTKEKDELETPANKLKEKRIREEAELNALNMAAQIIQRSWRHWKFIGCPNSKRKLAALAKKRAKSGKKKTKGAKKGKKKTVTSKGK